MRGKRFTSIVLILLLVVCMSGCSLFDNKECSNSTTDYVEKRYELFVNNMKSGKKDTNANQQIYDIDDGQISDVYLSSKGELEINFDSGSILEQKYSSKNYVLKDKYLFGIVTKNEPNHLDEPVLLFVKENGTLTLIYNNGKELIIQENYQNLKNVVNVFDCASGIGTRDICVVDINGQVHTYYKW